MIKTERQLAKTREQLDQFEKALDRPPAEQPDVHPILLEASRAGLREQVHELREDIAEYELLRQGAMVPDLSPVETLHLNLIRARIALGLTQADLASRLGIAEQQVQRYEASEYAGASLTRLREVAQALQGHTVQDSVADGPITDARTLRRRLIALGLPRLVTNRLIPAEANPLAFGDLARRAASALQLRVDELLGPNLQSLVVGAPGFKLPANARSSDLAAYTIYARALCEAVVRGTPSLTMALPTSPDELRAQTLDGGDDMFRALLDLAWANGIAVLPLTDAGNFHAAYWDIDGRHIIVLKQGNRSAARWAFDLAHEMCHLIDHTSRFRVLPDGLIDDDTVAGWAEDPAEARANRFASRVLLGPNSHELVETVVSKADGKVEHLKGAVTEIARDHNVDLGALANQIAFQLAAQDINWWGAASNLQPSSRDPWRIARDALLARLDLGSLNDSQRDLLVQALA